MTDETDAVEEARDKSKTSHIDERLGETLRLERDARGLSRAKLGEMLDLSDSTLQKYEEGKVRISASRLWQICNLLDIDVAEFFKDLPHRVERTSAGSFYEASSPFIRDDGRGKKAAAVARAAAKLPMDLLEIALVLIKALRSAKPTV